METITHQGKTIAVREVARPRGWSCRVLAGDDGRTYLEYLVSVGPYKIDVAAVHVLTPEQLSAGQADDDALGALARRLAEREDVAATDERQD